MKNPTHPAASLARNTHTMAAGRTQPSHILPPLVSAPSCFGFYCLKNAITPTTPRPQCTRSHAAQCKLNGPSFECTGLCKLLLLLPVSPLQPPPPPPSPRSPSLPFSPLSSLIHPPENPKPLVNTECSQEGEEEGGGGEGREGREGDMTPASLVFSATLKTTPQPCFFIPSLFEHSEGDREGARSSFLFLHLLSLFHSLSVPPSFPLLLPPTLPSSPSPAASGALQRGFRSGFFTMSQRRRFQRASCLAQWREAGKMMEVEGGGRVEGETGERRRWGEAGDEMRQRLGARIQTRSV